jgi:hypothetical protein
MNYERIYNAIVNNARSEDRKKVFGIYYERHHIIPRCMGGTNDKSNLILLTAKEHYMAHRLLCEIHPCNNKLQYAMWMMINGNFKNKRHIPSSKIYSQLKEEYMSNLMSDESRDIMRQSHINRHAISEETRKKMSDHAKSRAPMSEETKKKLSDINKNRAPMTEGTRKKLSIIAKGRILSEEHKKRISDAHKGKPKPALSIEHKKKISDGNRGKIVSEETKMKMSIALKGRLLSDKHKEALSSPKIKKDL